MFAGRLGEIIEFERHEHVSAGCDRGGEDMSVFRVVRHRLDELGWRFNCTWFDTDPDLSGAGIWDLQVVDSENLRPSHFVYSR
jgi:hypothetical protein